MRYRTEQKTICRYEDTLEALEDIEDGKVIAGEEVMSWLTSWGDEDELDPPRGS